MSDIYENLRKLKDPTGTLDPRGYFDPFSPSQIAPPAGGVMGLPGGGNLYPQLDAQVEAGQQLSPLAKGGGGFNYVVFSDKDIKITGIE